VLVWGILELDKTEKIKYMEEQTTKERSGYKAASSLN
jgi:hypothetical protein